MKVVVAGGTGFIGAALVRRLMQRGDEVAVISRAPEKVVAGRGIPWTATGEIATAEAIVNLAGENIGDGRWSKARKSRMVDSRLQTTTALVQAMRSNLTQRRTFLSASAVGYYGPRGDQPLDEMAQGGSGFLADLTRRWEEAARSAEPVSRLVIFRLGVVLAADGGALRKMIFPFRFGAGGPIGGGGQWMSWIDREDALRAIEWAIDRPEVRGTYNITAPEPVTNRVFARTLGRVLHRPSFLPTPAFPLRVAFGEMADEALLAGQRVIPARATAERFAFLYPSLESSLRHVLGKA